MNVLHLLNGTPPAYTLLARYLQRRCLEALEAGRLARQAGGLGQWQARRARVVDALREALGPIALEPPVSPETQRVSCLVREGYRIENVLIDAEDAWQVNATLYLPPTPGPHPAVVQPCGHSAKWMRHYQMPPILLARSGYACITYDSPWFGEKAALNDHYANAFPCYLAGTWAERYFILDTVRAIDYLASRPDIDMSRGVGLTGVSGGGHTSMLVGLLDDRVACVAPSCFSAGLRELTIEDLSSPDVEYIGPGLIGQGIDIVDWWAALAPKPCLLMAGRLDEVFTEQRVRDVAAELARVYALYGATDRFSLFMDESPHTYTFAMAARCLGFMDTWLRGVPPRQPAMDDADITIEPRESLLCRPDAGGNMHSLNRRRAQALADRPRAVTPTVVAEVLGLRPGEPSDVAASATGQLLEQTVRWQHVLEKLAIVVGAEPPVPGLLLRRTDRVRRPALLYIDEAGKWQAMRHGGFLARAAGFLDDDPRPGERVVLSIDVRGLGETRPQPSEYDLAGWVDIERTLPALAIGLGRPLLGLRTLDALACLDYLRRRPDVDTEHITVAGRGMGALVALHAAYLAQAAGTALAAVLCHDMLATFEALAASYPYAWGFDAILPGVLEHYDLPQLARALRPTPVAILNPVDAMRRPLDAHVAAATYNLAGGHPALALQCGLPDDEAASWALRWLDRAN